MQAKLITCRFKHMGIFLIKALAILILGIAAIFFMKQIIENTIDLHVSCKKKNRYDVSKQRNGIVLNKRTKKLEADQSLILPF